MKVKLKENARDTSSLSRNRLIKVLAESGKFFEAHSDVGYLFRDGVYLYPNEFAGGEFKVTNDCIEKVIDDARFGALRCTACDNVSYNEYCKSCGNSDIKNFRELFPGTPRRFFDISKISAHKIGCRVCG